MPGLTPRTRLIFQNLDLFVGPAATSGSTATGAMYTIPVGVTGWGNLAAQLSGANLIAQLQHVQSATLNVAINRTDVNIFGQLNRIDQIIISPPTISLDATYFPSDGYNEYCLGLDIGGQSFLSGILTKASDSKNYFIEISQQGIDNIGLTNPNASDVYAIGNGFLSNWTFNAAVGQITTASFTVDALAVQAYTGSSGLVTPAVDPATSNALTGWFFQIPNGTGTPSSNILSALRPGDIALSFPSGLGFLSPLSGSNAVNIQSVSISLPIRREILNRIGAPLGFSREIQFPVNGTVAIRALATEVQTTSFTNIYANDVFYNAAMTLRQPGINQTGANAIVIGMNNVKLASYALGNTINGDSTVDLTLTFQLAGALSLAGITFSGYYDYPGLL
jgi:hypothetical protein